MERKIVGELLYSHIRCADNTVDSDGKPVFVECRDENGHFKPKYAWSDVTTAFNVRGMVIHPGGVRVRLPDGVSRRPAKQDQLQGTLMIKYDKDWPSDEPCGVTFPTGAFGKSLGRYVDIYPPDDAPSLAQVGERIVSEWKIGGKPFIPPLFVRPSLPENVAVVEVHGVSPYALDKFAREAQAMFNTLVDPASKTRSVVCDVWAVKWEVVKGKLAYFGRVCWVVEVFDLDGGKVDAVSAAHRWPGSLPGYSLSTVYDLGFINRFPYCTRCSSTIHDIDKRHTSDKCPKFRCNDCGQVGHFRSACPRNSLPPQIGAPAITPTRRALPMSTPRSLPTHTPRGYFGHSYALHPNF